MTQNGAMKDMYKQIQELMLKCDKLSLEIKTVKKDTEKKYKKEIKELKQNYEIRISILETENIELKKNNVKLSNEVDRLNKQLNNDSDNSSNPPSSDIKKNIPNNRIKTNSKIGGQKGHKPHYFSKDKVREKIKNNEYKHEIIDVGTISHVYISKFVIDIEVNVIAKEYRFYKNENGKYNIPKEFKTDVQYGNELKTMCTILNTQGVVAVDRLTDFVSSITHDKINMSNATILNFINNLSSKSEYVINQIKDKILNNGVMNTDATTARCDNRNISVRNYSTNYYTLLKATKGKGKKYINETDILPRYVGNLVHDHETVMYNYGSKHGECNVHITRYLKGCYQNTNDKWCSYMMSLLNSLNNYKKDLVKTNKSYIDKEKLNNYSKRYDEILELGFEQNKKVESKFYKDEEKRLLNRLKKYKENHLLFLYDFSIPFDNNLSERDLRHVKTKQKISGYFKSMEGIQNYLNIKSIISTCKKQNLDFYKMIYSIFDNIPITI